MNRHWGGRNRAANLSSANAAALCAVLFLLCAAPARAGGTDNPMLGGPWRNNYQAPDVETSEEPEKEVELPAFPKAENFVEFYTGPTARNRFFVDTTSLKKDKDGTVYFALLVQTSGGARNISFEGMRCPSPEHRIYATGGVDGTWHKSRRKDWQPVRESDWNRHYAELFLNYFCLPGNAQPEAAQMIASLKERRMLPK